MSPENHPAAKLKFQPVALSFSLNLPEFVVNLSSLSSASSLYGANPISSRVSEALARPQARLEQQAESTRVQLSAYGQVRSATAQLESAASKLQENKQLSSVDGLTKAVQGFADAVNSRLATVNRVSGNDSANRTSGVLADDGKVRAANNETRRTLEGVNGSNRDALKQIGITVAQDGGVKVDRQALQNAFAANSDQVRQTLNSIGQQVARQSTQQLSATGSVSAPINRLNEQLGSIEQRQADNQSRIVQSQQAVQQRDRQMAQAQQAVQQGFVFTGIPAYNRIFSS